MAITPRTQNITKVFRSATAAEVAEARDWYRRARALAESLAAEYGGPGAEHDETEVERAAAVIAVLSPRLSWPKNVELARLAYEWHADGSQQLSNWPGLKGNALKAFQILGGATPDDVVKGPKVRTFWLTICDPTDPRAVVVDRHAFDVAVNKVLTDETRGKLLGRKGAYDEVATMYRRAAKVLGGITPAEVQAVTWTVWRRTRAAANHGEA
jgi:hypothetical protein